MAGRRRKSQQQELRFRSWGGRRPGAGRPRSPTSGVGHDKRPGIAARHPAHVTVKLRRELGNLRTKKKVGTIRRAIRQAVMGGLRVVDWSIQADHVHMIIEPHSTRKLSRGIQGLCIRIARGLNRELGRKGKVFADRYHVHVLTTPREVRNARAYVLLNARRHAAQRGRTMPARWLDPYSSWAWFDGWKDCPRSWVQQARAGPRAECVSPTTWLMRVGWRKRGLIRISEVPGGC